ncbi:hypothetical protein BGX26_011029 [Mortierella sp. AD094]|nr:hypothetical protein BGX26_011029 [Mortierella sp. AD094]
MPIRQFILALVAIVYVCSGESHIIFYPDRYSDTFGWRTGIDEYKRCYEAPSELFHQISHIKIQNSEWFKRDFTLTVYSNSDCSGDYKQWEVQVNSFETWELHSIVGRMDDRIESWKFTDITLGYKEGHIEAGDRSVLLEYLPA